MRKKSKYKQLTTAQIDLATSWGAPTFMSGTSDLPLSGPIIQNIYHYQCFNTSSFLMLRLWREHDHSFGSLSPVFIWSARVHKNSLSLLTATS